MLWGVVMVCTCTWVPFRLYRQNLLTMKYTQLRFSDYIKQKDDVNLRPMRKVTRGQSISNLLVSRLSLGNNGVQDSFPGLEL